MINKQRFMLKRNGEPYSNCYCRHPELIENYDNAIADTTQIWEVHHRKEELYSMEELKERGEYYDVPPEDLIFLTKAEHSKIDSMHKRKAEARSKKVLCIETGEIFESISGASRKTRLDFSHISKACNGKQKTAGGYHWAFC